LSGLGLEVITARVIDGDCERIRVGPEVSLRFVYARGVSTSHGPLEVVERGTQRLRVAADCRPAPALRFDAGVVASTTSRQRQGAEKGTNGDEGVTPCGAHG
jgi:hypothetical protein